MDKRKEKMLNLVIDNYIDTAEPVGSRFMLNSGNFSVGEATIRNELRFLEDEGYLTHPHTSAGRIPTKKGYRHYIDNLNTEKINPGKKENDILGMSVKEESDYIKSRKKMAKEAAELSNLAVLMVFSKDWVYYTGLSSLFSQPEFRQFDLLSDVSSIFDHCEDCLEDFYDQVGKDITILIGEEHPFGGMLSVIVNRFENRKVKNGLVIMMGPLRMDYKRCYGLMKKINEII